MSGQADMQGAPRNDTVDGRNGATHEFRYFDEPEFRLTMAVAGESTATKARVFSFVNYVFAGIR